MKEQIQNSINLEIPSRGRRFSAYLLDLLINLTIILFIPLLIYSFISLNLGPIITIRHFNPISTKDLISIIVIIISIILEIILIVYKHTSPGYKLMGIITSNNNNGNLNGLQSILRHFIFNPAFLPIILFLIRIIISLTTDTPHCHQPSVSTSYDDSITIVNQHPICEKTGNLRYIAKGSWIIGLILLFISIIEIFFKCPTFIDKLLGVKRFYNKANKTGTEIDK